MREIAEQQEDPAICNVVAVFVAIAAVLTGACGGGGGGESDNPVEMPAPVDQFPAPPQGNSLPGPRPVAEARSFVTFESGQVRPLALSADGLRLYAVNTPDNRLEIFSVAGDLTPMASVAVGLEPVAVAEAPDGKVWVVNHLSDSISVVDVSANPPRIVQTLWVGDEPRDIVFAGPGRTRAFITTAHRGQNSPVDPAFHSGGTGRADVWVFDSTALGDTPGGQHESILTLFGDRPRPLAVSPDGSRVYAGILLSGNRTTSIAPNGFVKAAPTASADGVRQPDSGVIVRFDGQNWADADGQIYNGSVPFSLPDYDVFEINADTLATERRFSGVGTILFNIAVNPVSGIVYVSNQDSRNHIRFAGIGLRSPTTLRGHVSDPQITVIDDGVVLPRKLNKHLDFQNPQGDSAARALSLTTLLGMAVSNNGESLYVSAFGSGKIGVYQTAALRNDSFQPDADKQISVTGGGPSGIVLDEANNRGFVLTRFDNGISTIDLGTGQETGHLLMFNPEPAAVVEGRKFLYDATITSGNGNDSCASCHIFGDTDGLAWDLGEPDAVTVPIPNVFIPISRAAQPWRFHPMKGPMTTQSMRGLKGHGPMHWRGDRTGSNRSSGETLEEAAFKEFNDAFDAFAALGTTLSDADMQSFTDFAMELSYPPNPVKSLDGQLTARQSQGQELFNSGIVRIQTGLLEVCVQCHTLNPARGLFGSSGLSSDNSQTGERNFKIPHFRDQYQKVGMFGWGFQTPPETGPQVRGFSFNHNGATSSNFILADLGMPQSDLLAIREFLYAFPTESPEILGQQVTLTGTNATEARVRIDLLVQQALVEFPVPVCDLIVKGVVDGFARGWFMQAADQFVSDRVAEPAWSRTELEALAQTPGQSLTFMCTPWGSGVRIGIDRDLDGTFDGDEA